MTIEPELLALMHAEIDGANSPRRSERLRRLLQRDAGARREMDELKRLAETLSRVASKEPPAGLREEIISSATGVRAMRGVPDGRPGLRPSRRAGRTVMRYGYALAAGIVIGVLGFQWMTTGIVWPPLLDQGQAAGSMIPEGASGPAAVRQVDLDLPGVTGSLILSRDPGQATLRIEADSTGPVRVALEFDPEHVMFRGFSQETAGVTGLEATSGAVSWTQVGRQSLVVNVDFRPSVAAVLKVGVVGPDGGAQEARLVLSD